MAFLLTTLNRYLCKSILKSFFLVSFCVLTVVLFFEFIEFLRKAISVPDVELLTLFKLSLLKLPQHFQNFLPFFLFVGSILGFLKINKTNELSIYFSIGISTTQITTGLVSMVFALSITNLAILSPITSAINVRVEDFQRKIFKIKKNLYFNGVGLWVKDNVSNSKIILHATQFNLNNGKFDGIRVFLFKKNNNLSKILVSKNGNFETNHWILNDVSIFNTSGDETHRKKVKIQSSFTLKKIGELQSHPNNFSFWKLREYIKLLKSKGLSVTNYSIMWHSKLSQVLLMFGLIILAFSVCLRPPRYHSSIKLSVIGIVGCFAIHFINDLLLALGSSEKVPVFVSAWSFSLFVLFFSLFYILHQEEHR